MYDIDGFEHTNIARMSGLNNVKKSIASTQLTIICPAVPTYSV